MKSNRKNRRNNPSKAANPASKPDNSQDLTQTGENENASPDEVPIPSDEQNLDQIETAATDNEDIDDELTEMLLETPEEDQEEAPESDALPADTTPTASPVSETEEKTAALLDDESEEKTEALLEEATEALIDEEKTEALMLEATEALMDEKTEALVQVMTEPEVIENTESLMFKRYKPFKHKKQAIIIGSIVLGFLLIGGSVVGYSAYERSEQISTGLENGESLLSQGNYSDALKAFENVSAVDTNNPDAIFGRAKALAGSGDFNNARTYFEDTLKRITDLDKMKQVYNAYIDSEVSAKVGEDVLFALMDRAAKETGDETFIKRKGEFMVKSPSFNLNPGAYQGTQVVEIIKGDPADRIFYTTDGSQPATSSAEYASAIQLNPGQTTIKTIEVGANGYPSKTVEGTYVIAETPEVKFENNIAGSWSSRSGTSVTKYYFSGGYVSYSYTSSTGITYSSSGNYQIIGVNQSGTIATLSIFNITGTSMSSSLNINCEPLGDNMISINSRGYSYNP